MINQKITFNYVIACLIAVLFTWILHEFTHWATSELLGYESIMRLNSVSPIADQNPTDWHKIYISASGPLITIIQALIVFMLLRKTWTKWLYPFLFTPFFMRFLAGGMNAMNPNDEGRISEFFGLGLYTISILVSLLLFFLVYKTSKRYQLKKPFHLWTVLIILVLSSALIMADQLFKIRII